MKDKKIIFPILVILSMMLIFYFSSQNASKSQGLSDEVASRVYEIQKEITKKETNSKEKNDFIRESRILIRKSAHFILYFILGIFLYLTFKMYNGKHPILYSIFICFLYACSDEIHQYFVSERTSRILDVFIDTCGASVGLIFLYFLENKIYLKIKR